MMNILGNCGTMIKEDWNNFVLGWLSANKKERDRGGWRDGVTMWSTYLQFNWGLFEEYLSFSD